MKRKVGWKTTKFTKLEESMALFKIILKWFCNASIILMLNKIDIFKKKIKFHSNTYEYFPRYKVVKPRAPFFRASSEYEHQISSIFEYQAPSSILISSFELLEHQILSINSFLIYVLYGFSAMNIFSCLDCRW